MSTKVIERAAKRAKSAADSTPSTEDARAELVRLVREHAACTKQAVSLHHQRSDRKSRETGDTIKCRLPETSRAALAVAEDAVKEDASKLEALMLRQLKRIPIFTHFLLKVYGCGPVVAAYLCADIDIHKATKPSNLRRFCGMAVIDGRLERRTAGVKSAYNANLRTRLFQMFSAMAKNAARKFTDRPIGTTSKYLDVWQGVKHRVLSSARVVDGRLLNGAGRSVSARGFAHSTGWHHAADVFLEDLYIVWRALECLPVWPSYYAAKLGYEHGGKICVNAPKTLTVDEALALVGDVGGRAATAPPPDAPETDDAVESDGDVSEEAAQ